MEWDAHNTALLPLPRRDMTSGWYEARKKQLVLHAKLAQRFLHVGEIFVKLKYRFMGSREPAEL